MAKGSLTQEDYSIKIEVQQPQLNRSACRQQLVTESIDLHPDDIVSENAYPHKVGSVELNIDPDEVVVNDSMVLIISLEKSTAMKRYARGHYDDPYYGEW